MANQRDKRTFYLYCPNQLPTVAARAAAIAAFPFNSDAGILALGGADIDLDGTSLGNRDLTTGWVYGCVVDMNFTGGSTTSDTSNRCNPNAESIESTTSDFSGTINRRRNNNGEFDAVLQHLACAYDECEPFFAMMLSCRRTDANTHGWWMYGTLKSWTESQPLNGVSQISFNMTPEPVDADQRNRGKVGNIESRIVRPSFG